MANRRFQQFFNSLHNQPALIDCNFVVDSTAASGLGVSSLKGPGVAAVYMHTAQAAITATSVFAGGALTIVLSSVAGLRVGAAITDSTTGGNLTAGTKIASINVAASSITLNQVTAGASAGGPGDTLSFANLPAVGSPNPNAGIIVVKLQDNYNRLFAKYESIVGPVGASTTSSKANVTNIISVLGTATLAQWQAVGLPKGVTPAVGVAFIGNQAALIGGSAETQIALAAGAGIDHIELAGDSNLSLAPSGASSGLDGGGSIFYLRCLKNAVLTAPTDGSIISLSFYLSNSRIMVAGE